MDIIFISGLIPGLILGHIVTICYDKYKDRLYIKEVTPEYDEDRTIILNNPTDSLIFRIHHGEYSFLCKINQLNHHCKCEWHDDQIGNYLEGYPQMLLNNIEKEINKCLNKDYSKKEIKNIIKNTDKRMTKKWKKIYGYNRT